MKGLALIGMMLTMIIIVFLTMSSMKKKVAVVTGKDTSEVATPPNLTDLPASVQSKLNAATKQKEDQLKAAEEALQ